MWRFFSCEEVQLTIFICHIEFSFLLIIIFIPIFFNLEPQIGFRHFVDPVRRRCMMKWSFLWFYLYVKFTFTLLSCEANIGNWLVAIRDRFWRMRKILRRRKFLRQFNFLRGHWQTCIHFTNINTHYYTSNFHNFCLL